MANDEETKPAGGSSDKKSRKRLEIERAQNFAQYFDQSQRRFAEEWAEYYDRKGGKRLSPDLVTDAAGLVKSGFPAQHAEAFQYAADKTNCVVACRAPGEATTPIIESGYDLKSFLIKAKSCDWGPMSGFLCQLTCFNKYGSKKVDDNDKSYMKYFKFICEKQAVDKDFQKAVKNGQTPFIPLKITSKRKEEILKKLPNKAYEQAGDDVVGVAVHENVDGEQSVAMEFLLRKDATDGELWSVYHGRVIFREWDEEKGFKSWSDFLEQKISYLVKEGGKLVAKDKKNNEMQVGKLLKSLTDIEDGDGPVLVKRENYKPVKVNTSANKNLNGYISENLLMPKASQPLNFYPILVAQNPFPPYHTEEDLYKNAVTGDYDLFAIWPVQPVVSWKDLVRLNDMQIPFARTAGLRSLAQYTVDLFNPVAGKPFALELWSTPDVYVEIIPGIDEIDPFEDPELGNINNAGRVVAGYLNDRVTMLGDGSPQVPGASFHSDEGGRPGIDEIDYDVVVFLPASLANVLVPKEHLPETGAWSGVAAPPALLIKNHVQFLNLVSLLAGRCFVALNHVWLAQLFALVNGKQKLNSLKQGVSTKKEKKKKIEKERKDYLTARIKELQPKEGRTAAAIKDDREQIKAGLSSLFLGQLRRESEREAREEAMASLVKTFTSLMIDDFDNAMAQKNALAQLKVKYTAKTPKTPKPPTTPKPATKPSPRNPVKSGHD